MNNHLLGHLVISLLIFSLGCSENQMEGTVAINNQSGSSNVGAVPESHNALQETEATENPSLGNTTYIDSSESTVSNNLIPEPGTAVAPVPVSGANLTCSVSTDGVNCYALTPEGQPFDFKRQTTYLIAGNPQVWKEIPSTQTAVGSWQIALSDVTSGSFAIGLVNAQNEMLADWVIDAARPPLNLVTDGSFEGFPVPNGAAYQYFTNTTNLAWTASLPNTGAVCSAPVLEAHVSTVSVTAPDGQKFIDLNSACNINSADSTTETANNSIISQQLALQAGHTYQLRFSAAKITNRAFASTRFTARFGGALLLDKTLSSTAWTEFKFVVQAPSDVSSIEFQEVLQTTLPQGTSLDKVSLYDLGAGPL